MSISEKINTLIHKNDVFISLRITNEKNNKSEIISNMPDGYKKIYYSNHYDSIDDTFDFTESCTENMCYPNSQGNYTSEYIKTMESHGYYNLVSFTIKDKKTLSCIVTLPGKPRAQHHVRDLLHFDLVEDIKAIVTSLSEISTTSDFDFSVIPDICH
ncbi:hypothetical protein [Vibrio quintilis]|uniref:Uncharacterized protein n=1 Tax=Vibrio quintilis TaxID=1117707 RepID=A0A1M7YVQ9_9VIBR|nr:hypothetical protein [Vibrio quintilis]SHO56770.1 hypothetical protein VQ7734_02539 [Vibrio quintilis]